MSFLALFIRLPTKESTGRMRVWRALRSLGCAILRDGVYLLPDSPDHAATLQAVVEETLAVHGSAEIYRLAGCDAVQDAALRALFNRSNDYAEMAKEVQVLRAKLTTLDGITVARRMQSLTRRFEQVTRIDFFPDEAQQQMLAMLEDLQKSINRHRSPDEPTAKDSLIPRLNPTDYRGRRWATRKRPWVDRLASAWLIRRYIDSEATFIWLESPTDCREDWLGFDFDGAAFSHVGTKVTFETLLTSFNLEENAALCQLGALVHFLDVGGVPVSDAPGVEAILTGARVAYPDDDALFEAVSKVFDWLIENYIESNKEKNHE